jgi:regulatory protein
MDKRRAKPPRPITAAYLDKAALDYLGRFASSAENLRRVLGRKVERSARAMDEGEAETLRAEGAAMIDALIERYRRSGLLDDKLYAEAKSRSLHRRGGSTRAIRAALAARGVEAEAADAALAELADEVGEPDLAAAFALARRRRLGPFRPKDRAENRDRDLAALGRAGFSYDIARKVVDAEDDGNA